MILLFKDIWMMKIFYLGFQLFTINLGLIWNILYSHYSVTDKLCLIATLEENSVGSV